jgi:hypothetical protein
MSFLRAIFRTRSSPEPPSVRRQQAWRRELDRRARADSWSVGDAIAEANWTPYHYIEPMDDPALGRDPVTGERVGPARRYAPPDVGSIENRAVHAGKVQTVIQDAPGLRDRRITGLGYDLEPRNPTTDYDRMRFGPWGDG